MTDETDGVRDEPAGDSVATPPAGDSVAATNTPFGDPRGDQPDLFSAEASTEQLPRATGPTFTDPTLTGLPTMPPPAAPSWLPSGQSDQAVPPTPAAPAKRKSRGKIAVAAGVVALVAVAGGVGAAVGATVADNNNDNNAPAAASPTTSATLGAPPQSVSSSSGNPQSYAAIAAAVLPVVVSIDVTGANESDTGSGVVIRADGYILTNNHVVTAASSSGSITVHFNDGTSASAKIVGTDLASDLAVVKVNKTGLQVAHLGDSSAVKVGDTVLAVGSPLGLSGTVTSGIVSALNRPVDTTADQTPQQQTNPFDPFGNGNGNGSGGNGGSGSSAAPTVGTATVFGAIQTDAAINPGNSGGALVDDAGNVIGINSAIASLGSSGTSQSGSIGVGFAIPINLAQYVANQLISTGKAAHAQIGVSVGEGTASGTNATTVVVKTVSPGSPGDKAGIKVGDVITKIDSTIATDDDTLIAAIRSHRPGDTVVLTISRAGTTKTVSVTLGSSSS